MTIVSDVMTRGVRSMAPTDTVILAAQAMAELNVGVIPVCDGDKLVGMVTDRDIVVRGVAQSCDMATTTLADVMSTDVRSTTEDQDVDTVLGEMADAQIRRLPVVDSQRRLVGIVTLGDIADKDPDDSADVAASLADISSPSEPDRSGQSQASGDAGGGSASGKPRRQQI
ncbi:MAG: CBS domain-containing protein [Ramlibacter sp.]